MKDLVSRLLRALARRSDVMYWDWWWNRRRGADEFYLRPSSARFGVVGRNRTSDAVVYRQVFVNEEYDATLGEIPEAGTIVDLGANVGYASIYMLSKHPGARVIAMEPDPENFALLRRNLAPYGGRCEALLAAAWSHPTRLQMRTEPYRGGGHWARQVEEGNDGTVEALDLGTLFTKLGIEKVSILKMDIEGAEVEVFSGNLDWISRVDSMMIELHDDSSFGPASERIIPLLEAAGFDHHRRGELTVFERPAPTMVQ